MEKIYPAQTFFQPGRKIYRVYMRKFSTSTWMSMWFGSSKKRTIFYELWWSKNEDREN